MRAIYTGIAMCSTFYLMVACTVLTMRGGA
jgi:hypothetical protein